MAVLTGMPWQIASNFYFPCLSRLISSIFACRLAGITKNRLKSGIYHFFVCVQGSQAVKFKEKIRAKIHFHFFLNLAIWTTRTGRMLRQESNYRLPKFVLSLGIGLEINRMFISNMLFIMNLQFGFLRFKKNSNFLLGCIFLTVPQAIMALGQNIF